MNYKKMFWGLIWLIVCFAGAFLNHIMPQNFQYSWGIIIGCFSMVLIRLAFGEDDR